MHRSLVLLVFVIAFNFKLVSQTQINGNLSFDGLDREYLLYVPASYDGTEAVPLVFNFHGYTSSADAQIVYGDFRPISERENFIIVHPQGTIGDDGETYFNAGWVEGGVDDIGFTSALIDHLSAEYMINQNRVYSTGMSNGGFMSYTLACELSDKIAAIASVTGSMVTVQVASTCQPEDIVPVMEIHGTGDAVVPYNGNNWMAPIDDVIEFWSGANDCTDLEISPVPDTDPNDNSSVVRHLYTNCADDTTVELFKIANGGHTWPSSAIQFGVTNNDINASEEIWRFFSQFDLNGPISSVNQAKPNEAFKICPSPVSDMMTLEFSSDAAREILVMDLNGMMLLSESSQGRRIEVLTDALRSGFYVVQVREGAKLMKKKFVKL